MHPLDNEAFEEQRMLMVEGQLLSRDIRDPRVIEVMSNVPRHLFVPNVLQSKAYEDQALPLGPDQTISQPYIVALMTQSLGLDARDTVLEVGTGSGYQAAILAELCKKVYTLELDEERAYEARRNLEKWGADNVEVFNEDGFTGLSEHAPFDAIIVTAAPNEIPRELLAQLKAGGRLILPLGFEDTQELTLLTKTDEGLDSTEFGAVRFVPMKHIQNSHVT